MRINQLTSAGTPNAVHVFRAAFVGILATLASTGPLACSAAPDTASANSDGKTGGNGNGTANPNGDGGANAAVDGGAGATGSTTVSLGTIKLFQDRMAQYTLSAGFARGPKQPAPSSSCPGALTMTMGSCSAEVYCAVPQSDAGTNLSSFKSLNAGTITVAGNTGAAGPATRNFVLPDGYPRLDGLVPFYAAGDALTVTAAGGPDLPAFPVQTVVAPADVTFTAPCTGSGDNLQCPDVDRSVDLPVAWTGGGAGKVVALFITRTPTLAALVGCSFNAADGAGTIPAALLAHLAKAGAASSVDSGIVSYSVMNSSPSFMVDDVPTTFEVNGTSGFTELRISK